MSSQNRLGYLFFFLLAPGFLTTVYTRAYNALHLEMFAFLGWGVLAVAGGVGLRQAKASRVEISTAWYAGFLFVMPALVILLQQAFGTAVPYVGMVAIAIYYLLVSACIFLLGSFAAAWFRNLPLSSTAGTDLTTGALNAFVGVALASALVGVAQYLLLPISGTLVSPVTQIGASYGNLRQPNLFALLGILGLISFIVLRGTQDSFQGRFAGFTTALTFLTLLLGVVLSTSRTGAVLVGVIFLWGLVESWRSGKPQWIPLLALPLYLLLRYIAVQLDVEGVLPFFGAHRQGLINTALEGDYARQIIWLKSWALIQAHPLFGVGFGNIAHAMFIETLPVPRAPVTEHAHNIFLQLAVELGLPVAAAWALALVALIVRSRRALETVHGRAIAVFLLAILTHSLLEYPLWYAYFLLPFAFMLGVFAQLGASGPTEKPVDQSRPVSTEGEDLKASGLALKTLISGGVLTIVLAVFGLWDYAKVSPSFDVNSEISLHDRVIHSYTSVLFLNLADYSALNLTGISPATAAVQLRLASRVAHFRFDPQVAAAHAAAASLTGQMPLAKASAYRLWLKDKDAAERLRLGLLSSKLPPAIELAEFLAQPTFVPWPRDVVLPSSLR
jgi:O-antigen ligase